jgi:hypothetical protein
MLSTTSVLERMLRPSVGDIPADYARQLLAIDFTDDELARHRELAEKSQLGTLTESERTELDDLLTANDLLIILHAKAQLSLKQASAA